MSLHQGGEASAKVYDTEAFVWVAWPSSHQYCNISGWDIEYFLPGLPVEQVLVVDCLEKAEEEQLSSF